MFSKILDIYTHESWATFSSCQPLDRLQNDTQISDKACSLAVELQISLLFKSVRSIHGLICYRADSYV